MTVKKNGKEKIIEANQEITETLLALSAKHDKLINFETTLQYFLCPGPLSLAHPDGTLKCINESSKSYKTSTEEDKSPPKQNAAFVVVLMALIRAISPVPVTYAKLVMTLVSHLPESYQRILLLIPTGRTL